MSTKPPVQKPPMTPEMLRDQRLKEKLHSWLYSLVNRLRLSSNDLTPNDAKFVRYGKANIQIVLTARSPEAIEKLKALGFEIDSTKDGITIFGRIAIEKIASLAELDSVKLVLPRI
ncbi:MAG: hypothetical protein DMF62_07880 [Acidobacteria bacterium]|nr:MAG: hypothetical protein DMF62_07880 [Acidobacteriota bacterium]